MNQITLRNHLEEGRPNEIHCPDGARLGGHLWHAEGEEAAGIINPATGVLARYYRRPAIGHFGFFHGRHAAGFWLDTLLWLRDGRNPWPDHVIDH